MSNTTNQERASLLLVEYSTLSELSGLECADVNSPSLFGDKPIHIAATRGDIDEIQLILGHRVDINCEGEHGYTVLHDAVEQGYSVAVGYLLNQDADPEPLNDDGASPAELTKLLDEGEILHLPERGTSQRGKRGQIHFYHHNPSNRSR